MSDALHENLLDAAYEGISFPVSECETTPENAAIEHEAYRRPGADIEDAGRRAHRGSFTIPLFNDIQGYGVLFPDLYERLKEKFSTVRIGQLTHPSYGVFTAHIRTYPERFDGQTRSGLNMRVEWTEHNASVSDAVVYQGQTGQDTSVTANQQAAAADAAMVAVPEVAAVAAANALLPAGQPAMPLPYTPTAPVVAAATATLESANQPLGTIQSAVASMVAVAKSNLAQPALQGVDAYAATVALETLLATIYQLQQKYLGAKAKPGTFLVPVAMPLWEVAFQVYDDISLASLIASANDVDDWTRIPGGTQLVIPAPPAA